MKYYLGIDLGGTNTKIGILDENGTIVAKGSVPTHIQEGPEAACQRIAGGVDEVLKQANLTRADIAKAGLASAGPMDIPGRTPPGSTPRCPGAARRSFTRSPGRAKPSRSSICFVSSTIITTPRRC